MTPHPHDELEIPKEKICRVCNVIQPLENFIIGVDSKWGRTNKCRSCTRIRSRENYYKNRERHLARSKAYENSERGKAAKRRAERNHTAKYPEKAKAHWAIKRALKAGRLQKQPCEVCGALKTEGHHPDHTKPLVVQWLCKTHHFMVEGRKGELQREKCPLCGADYAINRIKGHLAKVHGLESGV